MIKIESSTPSCEFMMVTPEFASNVLETRNVNNRRMRGWWVEALAESMRRNRFVLTHQGVAFTQSGRFIDGQHRLKAIVESGIAQRMLLVRGLPEEAFSYIDIGAKRSTADSTGLHKRTAEVCRLALRMISGGSSAMPDQVMELADAGLEEIHEELQKYAGVNVQLISTAPVRLAACVLVMDGHLPSTVFKTYANMTRLDYGALPPVALSFLKQKEQKKMNSGSVGDVFARALKALDPSMQAVTKIQVDEDSIRHAYDRARIVIDRAIKATAKHKK